MMELEKLLQEFTEWSIPTFKDATPVSSLEKLKTEIQEVLEFDHDFRPEYEYSEEYVDCIMCLFDSIARAGIDMESIKAGIARKTKINKARTWTKNDNNTYSHVHLPR